MTLVLLLFFSFLEWFRYFFVRAFFLKKYQVNNVLKNRDNLVAVLQPILSGDSQLAKNLIKNIRTKQKLSVEWIWLVDKVDLKGQKICKQIAKSYPKKRIRLVICTQAPINCNPKVFKLELGLKNTQAKYVAVLDDDTVISQKVLTISATLLEQKQADLIFGLPFYTSNSNLWSSLVSAFVNSNSLLTYIPYTFFFKPITINGMYYMTSRKVLLDHNVFKKIRNSLCDDFAIADLFNQMNLRLLQTNLIHPLNSKTESFVRFHKLLYRWLLFPVVSFVPKLNVIKMLTFFILVVLPVFSIWISIFVLAFNLNLAHTAVVLLLLLTKAIIFKSLNSKYLMKSSTLLSFFTMQLIVPFYFFYVFLGPREIIWRDKKIKVLPSNKIEIMSSSGLQVSA